MVENIGNKIDSLKLIPRFMMVAISLMCWQVTSFMISLETPTIEQTSFCSIIFGCFSACFLGWLNKETK